MHFEALGRDVAGILAVVPVSQPYSGTDKKSTVISGAIPARAPPQSAGSDRRPPDQPAAEEIEGDSATRETKGFCGFTIEDPMPV